MTDTLAPGTDPLTDDPQLRRIRALLAKAEATTFPAEAEAYMDKVAQLVARFGIDEALVWAEQDPSVRSRPVSATIVVEAPYATRKSVLVNTVAEACGCRAVRYSGSGPQQRISVTGFAADVRRVELLVTSLLIQMTSELVSAGHRGYSAQDTAAYRRSFLLAFAGRIGERLESARRSVAEDTAAAGRSSASMELVLVDRRAQVDAAVREKFPRLTTTRISGNRSAAGQRDGREAANRADLGASRLGGARASLPA